MTRLLGGARPDSPERQLKVLVEVRREGDSRYVADLHFETQTGKGQKRLEGESCDAIALATSVVIALAIDPTASLDPEAAPPSEETPALRPARAPEASRAGAEAPEAQAGPLGVSPYLQLSVGALFKLLSGPSAFASLGAGLRYRLVSLELSGALHQPRSVYRPDRPSVGAELDLYNAELLGCFQALPSELAALEVCAGAELDYLKARAFGVTHPDTGSVLLLAGVAALRGRLRATSWLSATLDVGFSARPYRPTFVLLGVGDVFEIPRFSPFARTGLTMEF